MKKDLFIKSTEVVILNISMLTFIEPVHTAHHIVSRISNFNDSLENQKASFVLIVSLQNKYFVKT